MTAQLPGWNMNGRRAPRDWCARCGTQFLRGAKRIGRVQIRRPFSRVGISCTARSLPPVCGFRAHTGRSQHAASVENHAAADGGYHVAVQSGAPDHPNRFFCPDSLKDMALNGVPSDTNEITVALFWESAAKVGWAARPADGPVRLAQFRRGHAQSSDGLVPAIGARLCAGKHHPGD